MVLVFAVPKILKIIVLTVGDTLTKVHLLYKFYFFTTSKPSVLYLTVKRSGNPATKML